MRSVLGLVASALAGVAAIIASLDGDGDIVPFFVALTILGGVAAWAAHPPFAGRRRVIAQGVALVWLLAATWVSVLLVAFMTTWGGGSTTVSPAPIDEASTSASRRRSITSRASTSARFSCSSWPSAGPGGGATRSSMQRPLRAIDSRGRPA